MTLLQPISVGHLEHLRRDHAAAIEHGQARAHTLWATYSAGHLDGGDLRQALCVAWFESFHPLSWLTCDQWREMFTAAGYTRNGRTAQRPHTNLTLYRGIVPGRTARRLARKHTRGEITSPEYGWSWTSRYADATIGADPGQVAVYVATVPPEALLAEIVPGEYVVDTTVPGLDIRPNDR